ncbi:MAG: leucine-rich repeat domain-containing protein, partial [Photobacterium halotolerans]
MSLMVKLLLFIVFFLSLSAYSNTLSFFDDVLSKDVIIVRDSFEDKGFNVYIEGENLEVENFLTNYSDRKFESMPKVKVGEFKNFVPIQSLKNAIVLNRDGQVKMLSMIRPEYSDLASIKEFVNLNALYIYGLEATEPLDLTPFKYLKYLKVFVNNSSEIIFPEKNSLKTINIINSEIKNISGLSHLKQLESLELTYTKLTNLNGLDKLREIKRLDLANIGEDFIEKISFNKQEKLEYLTSTGQNLYNVKQIGNLKNIKNLTLLRIDSMDEVDLPEKLESLLVRRLNSSVFPQIENCENLHFLMITDAKFTSVPDLKRLTQLNKVKLEKNQLSDISGLSKLTNLEELYLKDNNVTQISDLAGLKNLRLLDLEDNQIKSVSGLK